jgi:beta-hydroxylase
VRRFGKSIKKKNKALYYVLKWAIVLGILAWIFL